MPNTNVKKNRSKILTAIHKIRFDMSDYLDSRSCQEHVFVILFYRFISEVQNLYVNKKENDAGNSKFNFSKLSDKKAEHFRKLIIEERGYYIRPSELFVNVQKLGANDKNLTETLIFKFNSIKASTQGTIHEKDLSGLFDILEVKSKLPSKILMKLLNAIGELPLGKNNYSTEQFFENFDSLMRMFASEFGFRGGKFYTPLEVSELLARITVVGKKSVDKVYDPACGTGSLLLKFAEILGKENIRNGFFGQDISEKSLNLCRINMFLHDFNTKQIDIALGDTLSNPHHMNEQPFEAIVSNPPYSNSWDIDTIPSLKKDIRFSPAGSFAPSDMSDMAFVMHSLAWLAPNGISATLAYPGALYRIGPEMRIRKYLVDKNFVDAVIELPTYLFYGTTNAMCILVLRKNKTDNKVLFIDASNEFDEGIRNNRINQNHMRKIVDCFTEREECAHFSRLVDPKEIAENEYKLSVSNYVEPDCHDEFADIADLNAEIEAIISRQSTLRTQVKDTIVNLEGGFQ